MNEPTPPSPAAGTAVRRDRHEGLSTTARDLLAAAERALAGGDVARADAALSGAAALAPRHAEVLRLQAMHLNRTARTDEARILVEEGLRQWPDDAPLLTELAEVQFARGDNDAGLATLRRICELHPDDAIAWLNVGRNLKDQAWIEESLPALARAVALDPANVYARTLHADVLVLLGQFAKAREEYLEVLRRAPTTGPAWWGLANIKTVRLTEAETRLLEALLREPGVRESDRLAMGCVLGKAYEDHRRYPEAFAILTATNARISQRKPWDADKFSRLVDTTIAEFERPHSATANPDLGEEVIFIVSLPRSGSTLTEQILAAHPQVEGASELGEISHVLQVESERRRVDFPFWIHDAAPADWERLGREYLARTARWRTKRPRSTDKMPNNWYFAGAIAAMLPGARIVNCRRDPVETCWSCFKQMFSVGNEFSYDLGYLARLWQDYDRMIRHWQRQMPGRIRDQVYENLLAEPEQQVRALLDFCGLSFDAACLRFYEVERSVRTASAAQVREPLRRNTARTAGYGALLDPLRAALAAPRG
jgi:tetratricopeptide (TPR) repeat protein